MVLSLLGVPALVTVLRATLKRLSAAESARLKKVVEDLARLTEVSGG